VGMVTVRYFASLRERLGRGEERIDLPPGATVGSIWLAVAPPGYRTQVLAAVNQEYSSFDRPLAAGDELAFFPPVTGG